ncbi:MAG TPA: hypothetical protein VGC34_13205 [Steroidobacteraceae bacterium]
MDIQFIRDVVRRMRADEERSAAFRRAVADEGEAQLNRGEGRYYTAKRPGEIADTARRNLHSGRPIDREVLP